MIMLLLPLQMTVTMLGERIVLLSKIIRPRIRTPSLTVPVQPVSSSATCAKCEFQCNLWASNIAQIFWSAMQPVQPVHGEEGFILLPQTFYLCLGAGQQHCKRTLWKWDTPQKRTPMTLWKWDTPQKRTLKTLWQWDTTQKRTLKTLWKWDTPQKKNIKDTLEMRHPTKKRENQGHPRKEDHGHPVKDIGCSLCKMSQKTKSAQLNITHSP